MSVRSAKGSFQFCEVLRAEQVIHPFPHFVAEFSALGQCLPRGREVLIPDSLHGVVDVVRNILCKLLHPPAAVKGHTQQHCHDAQTRINSLHSTPLTGSCPCGGSLFSAENSLPSRCPLKAGFPPAAGYWPALSARASPGLCRTSADFPPAPARPVRRG